MKMLATAFVVVGAAAFAGTASGRSAAIPFFKTPSGNIGCVYSPPFQDIGQALRCDIKSGLRPRPARPKNCDLEYGDSLGMSRTSRVVLACHGDTVFDPREPVLGYGKVWHRGAFTCTSKAIGLRCSNRVGHGF